MRSLPALLVLGLAAGCADPDPAPPPVDPPLPPTVQYLSPTQHLTRASLALRGVRPTVADLEAVAADPAQLPAIVDRYLASPEFGETIKELHNETLLMRVEQTQLTFPALGPLEGLSATRINASVFDEPLRLVEEIVVHDRPYTEIVTADFTMADGVVAAVWGLPHTGGFDEWERTPLPGRGSAGILATSALYHRWRSAGFNYQRGRANTISRALLCHDYLHADIAVDTSIDLSDPEVVADAVVQNASCAGCHQTLDPLASYLFQFKNQQNAGQVESYPIQFFFPNRDELWRTTNERPPMFFGQETAPGLGGLGAAIAADPRFARCAARRFAAYFTEVAQDQLSVAWVARLQRELETSGMNARALAKAIVLSDEFRVSHDTDAEGAEHLVGALKLRPEQLARTLEDLTGFAWTTDSTQRLRGVPIGRTNLLAGDFIGFRVLAGGIDSFFVTEPVHTMNATSSLVAKAAASAAAEHVVEHDAAAPAAERTLFVKAGVGETGEAQVREQLAYLHARIYGELVPPTSPEVDDSYALFTDALAAAGEPRRAWKLVLVGMLSDFRSLFY